MWKFIKGLERECSQQKASFLQGIAGVVQPAVRKYERLRKRVSRAVVSFYYYYKIDFFYLFIINY